MMTRFGNADLRADKPAKPSTVTTRERSPDPMENDGLVHDRDDFSGE